MLEFLVLLILISILICVIKLEKRKPSAAELKGLDGERKVNDILKQHKLLYFHDTLLKKGSVTSQFDQIIVLPNKTILVIETKNKDGIITGYSSDEKWLQIIGKNRYYFYSPVLQNEGHIKMLYKKMDEYHLYGYKVLSLVVFTSERCKLEDVPSGVIHINELSSTLRYLNKKALFNRSRKFVRMLIKEDLSKKRNEVKKHKEFVKRVPHHKKTTFWVKVVFNVYEYDY